MYIISAQKCEMSGVPIDGKLKGFYGCKILYGKKDFHLGIAAIFFLRSTDSLTPAYCKGDQKYKEGKIYAFHV